MNINYLRMFLVFLTLPLFGRAETQQSREEVKMTNKRVLISGAGVAGLTLAYLLKQQGFAPTLVERSPILRTGGYKIDIRGAALEVLKRMGTYSQVYEGQTAMRGATFVDSSGRNSSDVSADLCGGRVEGDMEIMRGNLCEILFQQLEDVECLFGDCITEISQAEEGVSVAFEKNAPREFDLVVGADGLHSTVRKLAFGDESQFLQELGLYISVYTIPNILHLDQWEIEYFESHKFVNVYSCGEISMQKRGSHFPRNLYGLIRAIQTSKKNCWKRPSNMWDGKSRACLQR